ncbi:hypothetical protein GCM10027592_57490 [Spirosoma flavus]
MENSESNKEKEPLFSLSNVFYTLGLNPRSKPYTVPGFVIGLLVATLFLKNNPIFTLLGVLSSWGVLILQRYYYRTRGKSLNEIEKTMVLTFMGVLVSLNFAYINYGLLILDPKSYIVLSPDTASVYSEFKLDSTRLQVDKNIFSEVLQSVNQTKINYIKINPTIKSDEHLKFNHYALGIKNDKYTLYSYIGSDSENSSTIGRLMVHSDSSSYIASGIYSFDPKLFDKNEIEKQLLIKLINSSLYEIKKNIKEKNDDFDYIRQSRLKFSNIVYQYTMDLFNRDPKYLKPNSGLAKALDLIYAIIKYFFLTIIIKTLAQKK